MLKPTKTTKFAIARDLELISDGYDTIDLARRQLAHVEENMRGVGLEPDVQIVTVIVTTSLGKPKPWKAADVAPPADDEQEDDQVAETDKPSDSTS